MKTNNAVIIDTSVAFKWFDKSEEDYQKANAVLKKHLFGKQEILIPDLFFYELTNAWSTKSALKANEIQRNLEKLKTYSLTIVPIDFSVLEKTVKFAKEHAVSVYGAIYAVLASERKCMLITADIKFMFRARQGYISSLRDLPEE